MSEFADLFRREDENGRPSPFWCSHPEAKRVASPDAEVEGDGLCGRCGAAVQEPDLYRDFDRMFWGMYKRGWLRDPPNDMLPPRR